ncbi:MAG: AAA family ATPase [Enterococcus sp.]
MQPRKLTMKNFGPFINESLDFSDFQEAGLFLISGKTGAGKTTIFDGMTYALFGETSGNLRSGKEMRSLFAQAGEETQVTFTFEHQGFVYEIVRKPEQMLPKKRGSGMTEQAMKVQLTIYDQQQSVRQYTKKSEVDQKIKELLQLNAKQFFQIIMLPQGEFRNFLIASSNDKEVVLRNIFATEIYQRLTEVLKEKNKALKKQFEQQQMEAEALKKQFIWQAEREAVTMPELLALWEEELLKEQQQIQETTIQLEQLAQQKKGAEETFYQGKECQNAFAKKEQLLAEQATLKAEAPAMASKKKQYEQLTWVYEQQGIITRLQESTEQRERLQTEANNLAMNEQSWQKKWTSWQNERTQMNVLKQQVKENEQQQQQLAQLQPIAQKISVTTAELYQVRATQSQLNNQQQAIEAELKDLVARQESCQKTLKKQKSLRQLEVTTFEVNKLMDALAQLREHQQQVTTQIHDEQQKQLILADQRVTLAKEKPVVSEELKLAKSQQASYLIARLSLDLVEGAPCPVCGSLSHPQVHLIENDEEKIKQVEQVINQLEGQLEELTKRCATYDSQWEQTNRNLDSFMVGLRQVEVELVQSEACLYELLTTTELELPQGSLTEQVANFLQQVEGLKTTVEQAEQQVTELEGQKIQKEALKQQWASENQQQLLQENSLIEKINNFQEQLGEYPIAEIQSRLAELTSRLETQYQRIQVDEEMEQNLNQEKASLTALTQRNQEQLLLSEQQYQKARQAVMQLFNASPYQMDLAQFNLLVAELALREELGSEITTYEQHHQVLLQQLDSLEQQLIGQEPPDLVNLETNYHNAQERWQEVQEKVTMLNAQMNQNTKLVNQLKALLAVNQQAMVQLGQLEELVQTLNGDNQYKTSLERYVLQAYLAEILAVANQRLARLTKGRYQFELATGVNSNKKHTGLEINIYDDNAGISRRAHTLSGGESFIAALALALSLADVIQIHAGGIAVEALFIDEGFGSLDEESLEMALEALSIVETEGRMIGIISHVRELKERVTQQVLVHASGTGQSTITSRV